MSKLKKYINLEGDTRIWGVVFFLSIVSIVVVYSATGGLAYTSYMVVNMAFVLQTFQVFNCWTCINVFCS